MCSPSTTDAEDDSDEDASTHVSYTLTGGADQTAFTDDVSTAALTFVSAPDFEIPGSADRDNSYEVEGTTTDSGGITDTQTITVNVTNLVEYGFEREGILLSNPPIGAGFKVISETANDDAGNSVSTAGDINKDGCDDLVVGTHFHDAGGEDSGAAYAPYDSAQVDYFMI